MCVWFVVAVVIRHGEWLGDSVWYIRPSEWLSYAHYDGQAETMSLLLKQHCHESSSISPCLVVLYYMIEAKGAYKGIHPWSTWISAEVVGGSNDLGLVVATYIKEPTCEAALVTVSLICDPIYYVSNGSKLSNSHSVTYLFMSPHRRTMYGTWVGGIALTFSCTVLTQAALWSLLTCVNLAWVSNLLCSVVVCQSRQSSFSFLLFFAIIFSPSVLTVNNWSAQLLFFLNAPCSSRTFGSVIPLTFESIVFLYTSSWYTQKTDATVVCALHSTFLLVHRDD